MPVDDVAPGAWLRKHCKWVSPRADGLVGCKVGRAAGQWLAVRPDQAQFEGWFREHHLAVRRFAYRRVSDDVVDDVVAETFLTAWRRRDELVGDPLPWLLAVARRVCANHLRSRGRRVALLGRLAQERGNPSAAEPPLADGQLGRR
jgi:DNA-directed RNA polymerase specialized sigma24 family protein